MSGLPPQFEPGLPHQVAAIEAVCSVFKGQENGRSVFTVTAPSRGSLLDRSGRWETTGTGNSLRLLLDAIEANVQAIQGANDLPQSPTVRADDLHFSIEMETGTGKTYAFLRTIFELRIRYGFTKFIVVVPSVAIREGTAQSLRDTEQHFRAMYQNLPYDWYEYDSSRPSQIREFAQRTEVQIMVMTRGSLDKVGSEAATAEPVDATPAKGKKRGAGKNRLYQEMEDLNDQKPVDLIREVRPIVIIDEPQSVLGDETGQGAKGVAALHPLCTLRYSATHVRPHHKLFALGPIDAYDRGLVKKIAVAGHTVDQGHNKPYVKFIRTEHKGNALVAKLELDCLSKEGAASHKVVSCTLGKSLYDLSNRNIRYYGMQVDHYAGVGDDAELELRVPGDVVRLSPGSAYGEVDSLALSERMMERTIVEHFDRELSHRKLGIKVLSVFFLDRVADYRVYNDEGPSGPGPLAVAFEKLFAKVAARNKYAPLFVGKDPAVEAARAHDGYFSMDKSKRFIDTTAEGANDNERAANERAYHLIMQKKWELLELDEPLRFLFSHSALREGWDNPNVFQICVFREMTSSRERRQTIGRGLRLCVNAERKRVYDRAVNSLTVIARESVRSFADGLQKDFELDGVKFGTFESHLFAALKVQNADGTSSKLGAELAGVLHTALTAAGHIDGSGKVKESLKKALLDKTLKLPPQLQLFEASILASLTRLTRKLEIDDADQAKPITLRKGALADPRFLAIWDRIKQRTRYRVHFSQDQLVADCVSAVKHLPVTTRPRLMVESASITIDKGGISADGTQITEQRDLVEEKLPLPDILTLLEERTQLTRRTLSRVLRESDRLGDFTVNPQQFMEHTARAVNRAKRLRLVDGIKYHRVGGQEFFAQELFDVPELKGYAHNSMASSERCLYDHVRFDSEVEQAFAQALEGNDAVKFYVKLPPRFVVPTPLGNYNPDWAVLVEEEDGERLYMVVETKGTDLIDELPEAQKAKVRCGEAHFGALFVEEPRAAYIADKDLAGAISKGRAVTAEKSGPSSGA